jgi:LDH2 family malate/lactate/ureidoglycolate dehydrogenase
MDMPSGIDCMDFYTKKIEATTGLITETPVHNQYSHGADAFRTFVEALKRGLLEGRSAVEQNIRNTSIQVNREPMAAQRRKILVNRR